VRPEAVRADHLVTVSGPVHSPGWIVFARGLIVAVGRGDPPNGVDCSDAGPGSILVPGLVSAHTHLALGEFRGCADDQPFLPWLLAGLLPAIQEKGFDSESFARGAVLSANELLRGGVTLIGDNFFRDDGIAACAANGQRIVFFQEVFGSAAPDEDAYWTEAETTLDALERRRAGADVGYSPHTPWTCPPRTFQRVADRARAKRRRLSFHLDESREEHEFFVACAGPIAESMRGRNALDRYRFGMTPTALCAELGALGPETLVAHAVQVTDDDLGILARTKTGVAHCPRSNMKLAEGIAPVAAMLERGITVSLGVDSAASNSRLDLFAEMRAALEVQRAAAGRVGAMTAATVLRMATMNGAAVLGAGDFTGSLDAGKAADFVVLDASAARHLPLRDPVATVVNTCGPEDVRLVVIAGVTRHRRES
jgi:5-methylthioadenosine/S-adenosylhomocysteine deaminase